MSYVPKNVRDLAAKNDHYAKLAKEQALEQRAGVIAKWSERDPGSRGATRPIPGTEREREAGIKAGLATVKAARQERLKELFAQEALMYEAELNAMGLSLAKPRD
ncbi:hypothetical protein GPECTOR_6g504 [Gonium pectorale]|uniref:Uncharacterized protein n=1 Tax=Gonium pectorale TaxID=33097 RepID=A0A150GUN3_GONPE|nr:hypothetical protein GPECTOR_6g504 [Gonium pectorale]|eukprot:KXZ53587.1 hypothetical protein GPECTOR_6g504 [Gonium pectorale]